MNFDEIEKVWSRQTVAGARGFTPAFQQLLAAEVRQRTNSLRRIIAVGAFVAVIGWSVTLAAHFSGIRPLNAVTLTVLLAGTLYNLVFFAPAILSLRRMQREASSVAETLLASVRSSLRVVDWQIRNCTLLGYAMLVGFVGSVLSFLLEYFTHNLPARGLVAGSVMALVFTVAIAMTVRRYRQCELLPRRKELREQLAALED